jgi:tRNA-Thr(GGU) m(6)t(6)A37 methyltransferase TsaA
VFLKSVKPKANSNLISFWFVKVFELRMKDKVKINFESIGIIRTPYIDVAPHQPVINSNDEFFVELQEEYVSGLINLDEFKFIYLIFYLDRIDKNLEMKISPPWAEGKEVGLFASRSPNRPNPIGISIVEIKKIVGNKIYTSSVDVFNDTPLLDIKPYIKNLDSKALANDGWMDNSEDEEHLALHIKGIPHSH